MLQTGDVDSRTLFIMHYIYYVFCMIDKNWYFEFIKFIEFILLNWI